MNIVVKSNEGECFVRPDTTWERDAEDFYPPEFVSALSWTPVLFAHICKPGRSISERFAQRYFDVLGFGALLYPTDMLDGTPSSIARASCLDHTSFLTYPAEGLDVGSVSLRKNGLTVFDTDASLRTHPGVSEMAEAVCETSRYVYLRIGDIVAVELDSIKPLCTRADGEVDISMTSGGKSCGDFRIVF